MNKTYRTVVGCATVETVRNGDELEMEIDLLRENGKTKETERKSFGLSFKRRGKMVDLSKWGDWHLFDLDEQHQEMIAEFLTNKTK